MRFSPWVAAVVAGLLALLGSGYTVREGQTALVLNFSHERPHGNVSTEFHTESGPFTQVPLPGRRSSLVWVLPPKEAARLRDLPAADLGQAVEERMQSMLGKVTVEGGAQSFPLSGMTAERFGKGRFALVGEAAHALVGQVSEDGEVMQTLITFNFGANGWLEMPDAADELRDIAAIDGATISRPWYRRVRSPLLRPGCLLK